MSRPTSSEVIESGRYLEDDFDPATLTIPHLTAILNYHNIPRPTQSNKGKLIQAFNDEILPRQAQFRAERQAMESSAASSIGISDGMTGQPVHQEPAPVRRSSRVSSRAPSAEPTQRPAPMKRQRSQSEQPESLALIRTKRKASAKISSILAEESEEDSDDEKYRPRKPSTLMNGPSERRVSVKIGDGTDESPWEDTNIFQSGNDSSSPIRVSKPRSSTGRRRNTKRASMSAPPDSPTAVHPPSTVKFEPKLTNLIGTPAGALMAPDSSPLGRRAGPESTAVQRQLVPDSDEEETEPLAQTQLESYNEAVSREMTGRPRSQATIKRNIVNKSFSTSFILLVFTLCSLIPYKNQSQAIGYCEPGADTNPLLLDVRAKRQLSGLRCQHYLKNPANESVMTPYEQFLCLTGMSNLPWPNSCTPCPAHANCAPHLVTCRESFVLEGSLRSKIPYLGSLLDGWPILGPVALPPKCVVDERMKQRIKAAGRDLANVLAEYKGRQICKDGHEPKLDRESSTRKYGLAVTDLRNLVLKIQERRRKKRGGETSTTPANFDQLFYSAIEELVNLDVLTQTLDSNSNSIVASQSAEFDIVCKARLALNSAWLEWRKTVMGWFALLLAVLAWRMQSGRKKIQNARVSELVQTALDQLRQQELHYHVDPVTYRQPFLSPLQLRDYVLREEHSVGARKVLWDKVEHIVENNANVRVNTEEVQGDEMRVWKWIGGADTPIQNTPRK